MLTALSNERAAAPVAFQHRYISPFSVLDIGMISGYNHQSMLALVTPRYESGDVLNCVNLDSYAPRLSWVNFGFNILLSTLSNCYRSSKLQWLSTISIRTI